MISGTLGIMVIKMTQLVFINMTILFQTISKLKKAILL